MQEKRHISVAYDLFSVDDGGQHLRERVTAEEPYTFISGFGDALKAFEEAVISLQPGENFNITIGPDDAYGEYDEERVITLDKEMFVVDGRFDRGRVRINAHIPLVNEEGDRFLGRVIDITDEGVVIDLNHPLAGDTLNFVGTVVMNRPATDDEIDQLIRQLTCGCGGCGGDCGGGCDNGGCGGGGCDKDGCKH